MPIIVMLSADQFAVPLARYEQWGRCFPLVHAVLLGRQGGSVYAVGGDGDRATTYFVVNRAGFACALPGADETLACMVVSQLLAAPPPGFPSYLLWYDPPSGCRPLLDACTGVRVRERVRLFWRDAGETASPVMPLGFSALPLSRDRLGQLEALGGHWSRFWTSADEFLSAGQGMGVLDADGALVSACYAAAVAGGFAEVDVLTAEPCRGRGLATLAARVFVEKCGAYGLKPVWDCFSANAPSLALALRLGFVEAYRYPLYSFNVPLAVLPRSA